MAKVELVQSLFEKEYDLNKLTKWDIDFLYNISVFSVVYNQVDFTSVCPHCHKQFQNDFNIDGVEVKVLRHYKPITKHLEGSDYTFHVLSAQQYVECLTYAVPEEDEQKAYEDAVVAFTLGKSLSEEDIKWVTELPATVYVLCFYFQQTCFHGVALNKLSKCPNCHKEFQTFLSVPIDVIKTPLSELMKMYTAVAKEVTFDDFNSMTVPEYDSFIAALNERANRLSHGRTK